MHAEWIEDRGGFSWPYKIGLKVLPGVTRSLTQTPAITAFNQLESPENIDHILIVKGDGLSARTLQMMRAMATNARVTLYLWDSCRNIPGVLDLAKLCDSVLSFDPLDAARYGWGFRPLFSRVQSSAGAELEHQYDWSFVGSLHSDRHRVLRGLVASAPNLSWYVHCYAQNRFAGFARSYRDPKTMLPSAVPITSDIMTPQDARNISLRSRAVLDIEHPAQIGLTMRTIETLLDGQKLITTNANVKDYDLYDPSRVQVIDRRNPRFDEGFFGVPFKPIETAVSSKYLVDNWLQAALASETSDSHFMKA